MTDLSPTEALAMIDIAAKGLMKKKSKYRHSHPQNNNIEYYLDEKGNIRKRRK